MKTKEDVEASLDKQYPDWRVRKYGRINVYQCEACAETICTIDRDDGTTPMLKGCVRYPECHGSMVSNWYRVPQDQLPEYEWYRPENDRGMSIPEHDHYIAGGLFFRKIDG